MKKNTKYELRLTGSGGQGLLTAGLLLAEAVSIQGDYNVIQSQSYGPEARGGASKSEVIISKEIIYFPKARKIDLLLSLSQDACDTYYNDLKGSGILLLDSTFVNIVPHHRFIYSIPFTKVALEKFNKAIVTNIISLGAISELIDIIDISSIEEAIKRRFPEKTHELNKAALYEGASLVKKYNV
jgi:2-oxoglutarate ferredoxin oxidoreductase subunit gamma